jgi:ribonuclease BN (tRNA processing enzyme)
MSGMRLVALGVGDAFSALHYSTALAAVAQDGRWLLIDCPHPIRKVLREAVLASAVDLKINDLAGVALTHLHADHCSGLEGLGYYSRYVLGRPESIPLFTIPAVAELFRQRSDAACFVVHDEVERKSLAAGPFEIRARTVRHGDVPACAFRVECGGRSLGHSGDTVFDRRLIDWLAAANLVVHEVGAAKPGDERHTSYAELSGLPPDVRLKMRLGHYADELDLSASVIEPLRQGRVYEV